MSTKHGGVNSSHFYGQIDDLHDSSKEKYDRASERSVEMDTKIGDLENNIEGLDSSIQVGNA